MEWKTLTALLLLTVTPAFADFDFLTKGQAAPYPGYLITEEREQSFRLLDQKLSLSEAIIERQKKLDEYSKTEILLLSQSLDLYQKSHDKLAERLAKQESNDFWENTLYFGLGAILTGFIAYGAVQVTK